MIYPWATNGQSLGILASQISVLAKFLNYSNIGYKIEEKMSDAVPGTSGDGWGSPESPSSLEVIHGLSNLSDVHGKTFDAAYTLLGCC